MEGDEAQYGMDAGGIFRRSDPAQPGDVPGGPVPAGLRRGRGGRRGPGGAPGLAVPGQAEAARRKQRGALSLDELPQEPAAPEPPRYDGLWSAVAALPPERRAAVTLFYYEDMSLDEIARCLGVPRGTVKSRLARARAQLKEILQEQEGEYGTI